MVRESSGSPALSAARPRRHGEAAASREGPGRAGGESSSCGLTMSPVQMKVLPQAVLQSPGEHPKFMEQPLCPPLEFARIHLIKDKDAIDDYLAKNIKGVSAQEAAAYRNSYKKNICIDMLRRGYHKSFSELLTLIQKWNAFREAAGPGSAIWHEKSLEEQPDKLDQLSHFLTGAEAARRAGHYEKVYDNQLSLACFFNDPEDKWLSNYFYEQSYHTAQLVEIDGGKRKAQGYLTMGLLEEEEGHVTKAAKHFETFYELTEGTSWEDETGRTYTSLACQHLWRIYTLLADKMLENKQHQEAIKMLIKALKMAKEGGDIKMHGEAVYCLSLAYHFSGENDTALAVLNTSVEIFTSLCDSAGLGRAYAAVAKILASQRKSSEAVKYLGEFMKDAESANLGQSLVDANVLLGKVHNERGNYNEALEHFSQASEAAKALNNLPLVAETESYCGIAKAHQLMVPFNSHVAAAADPLSLQCLLAWKQNRSDMCTDPLPGGVHGQEDLQNKCQPQP
ncbi:tetratricopeptide repeat protein 29 isoform X2 [Zonotrichia leucophrys gambelii]|uniref:tetratricopeptide repeat protein 29 isoform X2 n=1 Tax=Zonotrichia leucophrys gambelii TaxID=257770 RepID=UPI00313FF446